MHTRRYTAFISYRHADNTQEGRRWAEWLHRALERYTVPPDLIGTPNMRGEPIRDSLYPIFRDEDELPANADLATGIRAALEVSDHLIVLCSPRSAVSPWVRKEVREFKELGRSDRILAIIIAGEPNADDPAKAHHDPPVFREEECFCEELRFGAMREDGTLDWTIRTEPLAADLRPVGTRAEGFVTAEAYREHLTLNSSLAPEKIATRTEAYRQQLDHGILKVAAGLLGVPLGQLVDRDAAHRAVLARRELERSQAEAARFRTLSRCLMMAGTAALLLALAASWYWHQANVQRDTARIAQANERDQRQKAEQVTAEKSGLLLSASYADHEAALRAFQEHREAEGIAYFERALRYAPTNTGALAAAAQHTFGMNAPRWRTRSVAAFEGGVTCIAFSPDGRYLAAGSWDATARVIEAATGKEISKVEFGSPVRSVSFSPNGRYLAAGSGNDDRYTVAGNGKFEAKGEARVIEAATGKQISKTEFGGGVNSVSFSPDGRHLAAGSWDATARVIEAATGNVISKAKFGGGVISVSFSPSGRYFVVGSPDINNSEAMVIEAATGERIIGTDFELEVTGVSFSPDGLYVAVGSSDGKGSVIDAKRGWHISSTDFNGPLDRIDEFGGRRIIGADDYKSTVTSLSFSPDGRYLAAGCENHVARVINVTTGQEIFNATFDGAVTSVCFSPDGRYFAASSEDKTTRVFDASPRNELCKVEIEGPVTSVNFSPVLNHLALACRATAFDMRVIDSTTGTNIRRNRSQEDVNSVSFSPDGHYLAEGNGDAVAMKGYARVIESATGMEISRAEFLGPVNSVSFSPDGRYLAAGSWDKTARVIEVTTGKEISKAEFGGEVMSVSFSPDGRHLAAGSGDKTARVIEVTTGKEITKVEFGGEVRSVSFSPDGCHLAAGSGDKTARVIEVTTGKEISKSLLTWEVNSVTFSPDGCYYWAGSGDDFYSRGEAHLIETVTAKKIGTIYFGRQVNQLAFDSKGNRIAAGVGDGCVEIVEARWSAPDKRVTPTFAKAIQLTVGSEFQTNGRLGYLSAQQLCQAQSESTTFIQAPAPPEAKWQHSILTWASMTPETRTTSPWTTEPLRVAAGRWFMQASGKVPSLITDTADEAPWHPLEPISLARLEPKPNNKTTPDGRESLFIRPTFLARLTLKRLRDADEKLYGRDTLGEYAAWCAQILHEELHLDPEAKEALAFALERTPPEKQKDLLELKATFSAK